MLAKAANIILRQTLEFDFNGNADGFVLQQETTRWCHDELTPAIESAIDAIAPEEQHLKIDSLFIELSIDGSKQWSNNLAIKICDELSQQLKTHIHPVASGIKTATTESRSIEKLHQQDSENFFELLSIYLQHGYFPWWSSIHSKQQFETKLNDWLQAHAAAFAQQLVKLLASGNVKRRISYNFSPESFALLISALLNLPEADVKKITEDAQFINTWHIPKAVAVMDMQQFHLLLLENIEVLPFEKALAETIRQWINKAFPFAKTATAEILQKLQSKHVIYAWKQESSKHTNVNTVLSAASSNNKELVQEDNYATVKKDHTITPVMHPGEVQQKQQSPKEQIMSPEGIYINNAGAVIIAAFLPVLFYRSGLLHAQQILHIDKAVNILQYAITGRQHCEEFELVLPKLLCGVEIDAVIRTDVDLTEAEANEVNNMLQSVIEHWNILKNTSVDGLQESFLKRNGKLGFYNNEWHLQVEQKPFDMLLQQLPWNISMIRLAWMKHVLKTEWLG